MRVKAVTKERKTRGVGRGAYKSFLQMGALLTFYKGTDNTYFRLCRSHYLSVPLNPATIAKEHHEPHIN